jgi:hypothetical protein
VIERIPGRGRLVIGVLWREDHVLEEAGGLVKRKFGEVAAVSEQVSFSSRSDYYDDEMGPDLKRVFWHMADDIPRGALAEVKLATNRLERESSQSGKRLVNLDPGVLSHESLVLATTKPFSHRVYMTKGIYGEVTLVYRKNRGYEPLPWTYWDYKEPWAREFFETARQSLG